MKKTVSALLACVICLGTAVSSFAASDPEWVIKPEYDTINTFSDGFTTAKKCGTFDDNGLTWTAPAYSLWNEQTVTYIDKNGNVKFNSPEGFIFQLNSFGEGLASQVILADDGNSLLRYINTAGQVVFSLPGYTNSGTFKNGYAWVERIDGKEGIIDKKGNFVLQPKYIMLGDVSPEGITFFKDENGLRGFMDLNGNITVPAKFQVLNSPREGISYASEDGKICGIVNTNGEYLIAPQFIGASLSHDGLINVKVSNGKVGVIKNPLMAAKK